MDKQQTKFYNHWLITIISHQQQLSILEELLHVLTHFFNTAQIQIWQCFHCALLLQSDWKRITKVSPHVFHSRRQTKIEMFCGNVRNSQWNRLTFSVLGAVTPCNIQECHTQVFQYNAENDAIYQDTIMHNIYTQKWTGSKPNQSHEEIKRKLTKELKINPMCIKSEGGPRRQNS